MIMADNPQGDNDKHFIQNLIINNVQVVEEGHDDRKIEVVAILNRVLTRGRRRERYARTIVSSLLVQDRQPVVVPTLSKPEMVRVILGVIPEDHPPQTPPTPPQRVPPVIRVPVGGLPVGLPPPGWGHLIEDDGFSVPPAVVRPLLRLKRGEPSTLPPKE